MHFQVAIITGANGGMGREITKKVASAGYITIMACRSIKTATPVYEEIKKEVKGDIRLMELDLASFISIKNFIAEIKEKYTHIDLLLNNAGVLCHTPQVTEENIEKTVGVNYLGHYILSHQLLPLMRQGTRIVNMVSLTYKYGKIDENLFKPVESDFKRFTIYSNSKLAFFYFTMNAAEAWKEKGITVNCADPGIVSTKMIRMGIKIIDDLCDIFFRPLIKSPSQGARTLLHLALSEDTKELTGQYFLNKKRAKVPSKILRHPQRHLLESMTQQLLETYF